LVLRLLAPWADHLALGEKLVQEVGGEVGSLDQELADKPDQSELDVRKVTRLVEPLDDAEHVDEVEPVALLWPVLLWAQRLLENELADEVDGVILWMEHGDVKDLQNLVDEDGEHALVLQPECSPSGIALVQPVVIQGVLDQEEHRLHQLCCLDQKRRQLRVSLERLEQEVKNRVERHVH
jgi:hypothetical protein